MVVKKHSAHTHSPGSDGFAAVPVSQLPPRHHKGQQLLMLPEITAFMSRLKSGPQLSAGEAVYIKLDKEKMASLKVVTPGRIVRDVIQNMLAAEGIKSKTGNKLQVEKYKAEDGEEVIYVSDAVEKYARASSLERTKLRNKGGR